VTYWNSIIEINFSVREGSHAAMKCERSHKIDQLRAVVIADGRPVGARIPHQLPSFWVPTWSPLGEKARPNFGERQQALTT
jgi:hypothetical protein